jgi:hypothetical protein
MRLLRWLVRACLIALLVMDGPIGWRVWRYGWEPDLMSIRENADGSFVLPPAFTSGQIALCYAIWIGSHVVLLGLTWLLRRERPESSGS